MAQQIEYLICPSCAATSGRGSHFTEGLDTRTMFIKDGMAVLLCPICGREFVMEQSLKCSVSGCDQPVTKLIVSKHSNVKKPVGTFCEQHKPTGFRAYLKWYLLMGGQDAVPYIADDIKTTCIRCGNLVTCSNKVMGTKCPNCGKEYVKSVHLFGPATLEAFGLEKGDSTKTAPTADASANTDYDEAIAEQLCKPVEEQFCVSCPNCGVEHQWNEERVQGGEPQNLLQAIFIIKQTEEIGQKLGMSNELNRSHGWVCSECGHVISQEFLATQYSFRDVSRD